MSMFIRKIEQTYGEVTIVKTGRVGNGADNRSVLIRCNIRAGKAEFSLDLITVIMDTSDNNQ